MWTAVSDSLDEFYGPNAGYVAELFERYQRDPNAVDPPTRAFFADWQPATAPQPILSAPSAPASAGAAALAQAIRFFGHLGAQLDPLGSLPRTDSILDPATHGAGQADLAQLPASVVGGPLAQITDNAAEAIRGLRQIYSGTTGYEFSHLTVPEERSWLMEAVESGRFRPPADPVDERSLLDRLTEISAFERFLQRAHPGQTRFSIEGLGMMIPMLDELIDRSAASGTRSVVLGMAHRGRLNVLAHVLGKPYEQILAEFEGRALTRQIAPTDGTDQSWTGDVKYHAGGRRAYNPDDGESASLGTERVVTVILAPNPSHLEAVDPVVQGMARAANEPHRRPGPDHRDEVATLAVLIHGDASFPAQGVVAETLNLSGLPGYRTGGTLHLIANNQLGFTTQPAEARSTLYASDLAKGFEIPIVHVNADDPLACLAATRLAVAYRARFQKDFLIDLIGYRRWGHNEGDEPSFTQPTMYRQIREHPTVRELFAADLVRRGVIPPDEPAALLKAGLDEFQRLREGVLARRETAVDGSELDGQSAAADDTIDTADDALDAGGSHTTVAANGHQSVVSLDELRVINAELLKLPNGFALNGKLERAMQRRRAAFEQPDATIDWGHAETLALATILRDGTPIRLTGQDAVRGTFSQRHLSFYDERTGASFTPLAELPQARAEAEIRNSPLSENAVLGFEYGYSVQARETLVLWEAQYGDFINGAQVVVDEFIASGQAKWGLTTGLVLLLPHAWEGQGPDHSSGRLERFLQLAADDNLCIVNCSTAAQYFHLLRRQAETLRGSPRPLVIMTPKSLLRHPLAVARAAELSQGCFRSVLDDPLTHERPQRVRRVVLCSGKVWADVLVDPARVQRDTLAVVRVEELYPFPAHDIRALIDAYAGAEEVVWLQEEPRNMGAWTFVQPRLRQLLGANQRLQYVGRPEMASPAEGWADVHALEQRRLVETVLQPDEVVSHAE
jgi:2-oxoglutarate dehydrogenase E1 component